MRVGLVVPCYIDVFYPQVGIADLELLERLGVQVEYPFDQICYGQPMANSGRESDALATEELFIRNFAGFEYIVIPSGSCTIHGAYRHPRFKDTTYAVLMTGPSGSADIAGTTVHPAQGVKTLTVIMWPVG